MAYWKTTKFWGKVRDSIAVFGSLTTAGLAIEQVPYIYILISTVATVLGSILSIWMTDEDNNGNIDLFEDKH